MRTEYMEITRVDEKDKQVALNETGIKAAEEYFGTRELLRSR